MDCRKSSAEDLVAIGRGAHWLVLMILICQAIALFIRLLSLTILSKARVATISDEVDMMVEHRLKSKFRFEVRKAPA